MKKELIIIIFVLLIIALVCIGIGFFVSSFIVKTVSKELIYKNSEYGFEITLPNSWAGYSIDKTKEWDGIRTDQPVIEGGPDFTGPEVIIKNPKTTTTVKYQDIPIMVFTPDVWKLVQGDKVAVSAAPIGPFKIGENAKYVFATPPRWYGFTDDQGWQEAVNIVKTFKAF